MYGTGGKTSLVEFSYGSKVSPDLPAAVVLRLARQAWSHNTRMGLTGVLRFAEDRFEQVIEGPSEVVLPLAARILTDLRHGAISIRGFRAVEFRRYPTWSLVGFDMGTIACTAHAAAANLCFLPVAPADRAAPTVPAHGVVLGTS